MSSQTVGRFPFDLVQVMELDAMYRHTEQDNSSADVVAAVYSAIQT
jgi:hypothetical protein